MKNLQLIYPSYPLSWWYRNWVQRIFASAIEIREVSATHLTPSQFLSSLLFPATRRMRRALHRHARGTRRTPPTLSRSWWLWRARRASLHKWDEHAWRLSCPTSRLVRSGVYFNQFLWWMFEKSWTVLLNIILVIKLSSFFESTSKRG